MRTQQPHSENQQHEHTLPHLASERSSRARGWRARRCRCPQPSSRQTPRLRTRVWVKTCESLSMGFIFNQHLTLIPRGIKSVKINKTLKKKILCIMWVHPKGLHKTLTTSHLWFSPAHTLRAAAPRTAGRPLWRGCPPSPDGSRACCPSAWHTA